MAIQVTWKELNDECLCPCLRHLAPPLRHLISYAIKQRLCATAPPAPPPIGGVWCGGAYLLSEGGAETNMGITPYPHPSAGTPLVLISARGEERRAFPSWIIYRCFFSFAWVPLELNPSPRGSVEPRCRRIFEFVTTTSIGLMSESKTLYGVKSMLLGESKTT